MNELYERYPVLNACRTDIEAATAALTEVYKNGGKLLLCGNGGSAADCEHIVGELMKGFLLKRTPDAEFVQKLQAHEDAETAAYMASHLQRGLPAISLPSQSALLSAFANDVASDMVYAQLVYAYGRPGDAVLCLSTSGNSKNCVMAARAARAVGLRVIALTGAKESALSDIADITIRAPETETFKVQELHLPIYHAICVDLENTLIGE